MKKVLITGGAGFLGYHTAHGFAQKGVQSVLLDIAPFDPSEYPPDAEFIQLDVRDREGLKRVLGRRDLELIVHGAAALPLWKREDIFSTNVEGTRHVVELALECGIPRVVFISSTAVYGVPKKHPIYEDDPLQGVGPYGESKILAEQLCLEFRQKGLCVPIIRPKTFIGPARLGVFQILYDWVHDGKRIPMIGAGHNRYQLLDVADLVEAIWMACTLPAEQVNETFNVGAKEFGTVREDLQALCDFAGTGARPMGTPAGLVKPMLRLFERFKLSPLYKWVYETADKDSFVSIERIEERLGWRPQYSNAQALIRAYQWYLENAAEVEASTGVTHRVAWNQGILRFFKRWL